MQFRAVSGLGQWCFDGYINQLFGSCVNALTTDCEIRRNYPSLALYFSPLLHPTHPHAHAWWSAQGTRAVGRLFSRCYQISHAIQVCRLIHLGDAHSKQWATLNASSLWAYLVDTLDNIHEVHLRLIYKKCFTGLLTHNLGLRLIYECG